ncbi:MAG: efflux RND transporter permease subunit, partial [Rhizobiaceae bacterium]
TAAGVLALFIGSVASFGLVKDGFFPASTRAQFVIDFNHPAGTDIQTTAHDILKISEWVRTLDGVIGTNTVVGGGHLRFMLTYSGESPQSSYAQILADVEDYRQIEPLLTKIQAHIRTEHPDAYTKVWRFVLGPGGDAIIQARFTGSDPVVLRTLANKAKDILTDAGAVGVDDDWREMVKVIRPRINEQNARRAGLTRADISRAIAERFDGAAIGVFREGNELRQIIFRPEEKDRSEIDRIREVQIFSLISGRYIPISQVVDRFDVVFENQKVRRFDRSLAIMAEADPASGVNGGELFDAVRSEIEAIQLPPGYALEWRGQHGSSIDANAGLASTMPFGFGAMIVIVILLFNAFRQPLIIWLTVPLALIGVVTGLVLTGTPLEFMAILGVLSLTGMLIKNAIVLIDETDNQIADGNAPMLAVVESAVSRVRPVSLGVLTTVLGVMPLLWDPFFESLAVVIIWGLSFATVLTLIIVPTLYAIFFKVENEGVDK